MVPRKHRKQRRQTEQRDDCQQAPTSNGATGEPVSEPGSVDGEATADAAAQEDAPADSADEASGESISVVLDAAEHARLVAAGEQAAEYLELAQRKAAELQNLQGRMVKERRKARDLAVRDILLALLPSFDNLERALEAGPAGDVSALTDGVRMVHSEIQRILGDRGLSVITPEPGETLDPNLHEAVFSRMEPDAEGGTILEVFEKGYRLGEVLVRPARVVVASRPDEKQPVEAESGGGGEPAPADSEDGGE